MFRVDWLAKGTNAPQTTWHPDAETAERAAWRLEYAGVRNLVWWFDAAVYEGMRA